MKLIIFNISYSKIFQKKRHLNSLYDNFNYNLHNYMKIRLKILIYIRHIFFLYNIEIF